MGNKAAAFYDWLNSFKLNVNYGLVAGSIALQASAF